MSTLTFQILQLLVLVAGVLGGLALSRRMLLRRISGEPKEAAPALPPAEPTVRPPIAWIANHLLPALDGLDDAIAAAASSSAADVLVPFMAGVRIVQSQFFRALEVQGVLPISVEIGEPFDPELHSAVDVVVAEDKPAGTVAAILRRGYKLSDNRLLRPAAVLVNKRAEHVAGTSYVVAGTTLLALVMMLLSGCFESGYLGGWLLGRSSSQSSKADAGTKPQDAGEAATATSSNQ